MIKHSSLRQLVIVEHCHKHVWILRLKLRLTATIQQLLLLLQHHYLLLLLLLLLLNQKSFLLHKPLWISIYLIQRNFLCHTRLIGSILSLLQLFLVQERIKSMHFPHFLNFIEINYETPFICMVFLYALSAEHSKMVGTVKMLHSLIMLLTKQTIDTCFNLEVNIPQYTVSLYYFIKNIEVQW